MLKETTKKKKKRTEERCVIRNISILNINVNMLKRLEILETVAKKIDTKVEEKKSVEGYYPFCTEKSARKVRGFQQGKRNIKN